MLRAIVFSVILAMACSPVISQDWIGFETGNYAGLHRLQMQPADLAGMPYKYDINVFSFNTTVVGNDFLPNYKLIEGINGANLASVKDLLDLQSTNYFLKSHFILPSIAYSIDEKSAVSAAFSIRAYGQFTVSDPGIIEILSDAVDEDLENKEYSGESSRLNLYSWSEFKLSYARELFQKDEHKVKAGATLRFIQGLGEVNYFFGDLNLKVAGDSALSFLNMDLGYRYNEKIEQLSEGDQFRFFGLPGFAFDIGASYEHSDEETKDQFPGYRYKVGFSLSDVGVVRYNAAKRRDVQVSVSDVSLSSFTGITSFEQFVDTLDRIFDLEDVESSGSYTVALPSVLAFMGDYNFGKNFYASIYQATRFYPNSFNIGQIDPSWRVILTPRYEDSRYGVYLPTQYSSLAGYRAGLSLRWKGITLGSANIISRWFRESGDFVGDIHLIGKYPILTKEQKQARKKKRNKE